MLVRGVFVVLACLAAVTQPACAVSLAAAARVASTPQKASREEFATVRIRATILDDRFGALEGVGYAVVEQLDGSLEQALAEPLGKSDAKGSCSFEAQVPRRANGRRWLVFGGRGLATQARRIGSDSKVVDLGAFAMARGSTVAGRVRDTAGQPIAGAVAVASDLLDELPHLKRHRRRQCVTFRTAAASSARGIFQLTGMVPSLARVVVRRDGYFTETVQHVGVGEPLDVVMRPSPKVGGIVLDAAGAPVADARIYCQGDRVATSVDDGSFSFHLRLRAPDRIAAYADVAGERIQASKSVAAADWGMEMQLQLAAGGARRAAERQEIVVRAVDAAGQPVPAFRAFVSWNEEDQLQYRPDAVLLAELVRPRRGARAAAAADPDWVANAVAGEARPAGDAPGSSAKMAMLFVLADGHGLGRVKLSVEDVKQPVVVTLAKEIRLRGRVTDTDSGEPIAGVRVVPTERMTRALRLGYANGYDTADGMREAPTAAVTDGDGRFQLLGLRAGETDIFLLHPDRLFLRPTNLLLTEEVEPDELALTLPAQVVVAGIAPDAPTGMQVRLQWERPGMMSSAWVDEYGGARDVAPDGSFSLAAVQPKSWQIESIVAAPPRGGRRLKAFGALWKPALGVAADGVAKPVEIAVPRRLAGEVGGSVPWHRLAVMPLWLSDGQPLRSLEYSRPIALLQPDRSFRLLAPSCALHLLVFDVLTGVPLAWHSMEPADADASVQIDCEARPIEVTFSAGDGSDQAGAVSTGDAAVHLELELDEDDWPYGIGAIPPLDPQFGPRRRKASLSTSASERLTLWVRSRRGILRCQEATSELDLTGREALVVPLAPSKR